jgi:hypothetical protein
MIGEEVTAIVMDGDVDEALKCRSRVRHAPSIMIDVQVEDDAGIAFAGPREECLGVTFDQAHGSIDEVHLVP